MYNFSVLWKNEVTADVSIKEDASGFKTLNYIKRYTDDIAKQPFGGTRLDLARVYEFLEGRWFERERPDVLEALKRYPDCRAKRVLLYQLRRYDFLIV